MSNDRFFWMALSLGCFRIFALVFQCVSVLTLHLSFQTESRSVSVRCKGISSAYWKFAQFTLELFILLLYYISFVFTRRLYCFLKCAQNNFLWVTNEVITVVNRTHQFAFIDTVHTFFWDKTVNFECIFKQVYDEYRLITVSKDFFQYYV